MTLNIPGLSDDERMGENSKCSPKKYPWLCCITEWLFFLFDSTIRLLGPCLLVVSCCIYSLNLYSYNIALCEHAHWNVMTKRVAQFIGTFMTFNAMYNHWCAYRTGAGTPPFPHDADAELDGLVCPIVHTNSPISGGTKTDEPQDEEDVDLEPGCVPNPMASVNVVEAKTKVRTSLVIPGKNKENDGNFSGPDSSSTKSGESSSEVEQNSLGPKTTGRRNSFSSSSSSSMSENEQWTKTSKKKKDKYLDLENGADEEKNHKPRKRGQHHGPPKSKICTKCERVKPERAHHCSVCRGCVLKMDHHCPWVNNCIGLHNYHYFVMFLFWTWMTVGYYVAVCCKVFGWRVLNVGMETEIPSTMMEYIGMSFVLCISVFVAVGCLGGFHFYLTLTNQSTIEFQINSVNSRELKKAGKTWHNAYDLGYLKNLQEVVGKEPFHAFFTWSKGPCKSKKFETWAGISYPKVTKFNV